MELDHTNFVKSGIAEHDVYIVYNTIAKRCQSIESMIKQLSDSKIREYFRDDGIKRTR